MTGAVPVRRALLAVHDKRGIVDLARGLRDAGFELVSSGGTAATLHDAGVDVTSVEQVTGSPEMLGGRVKTLHPRIHAGILADRRDHGHVRELEELGIEPFDVVVVNLYPFGETVRGGADADDVIEQIDVGGPAMIRAAAKNFESVAVVVDPDGYGPVLEEVRREGDVTRDTRRSLAARAFAHTAAYDAGVASWFTEPEATGGELPAFVAVPLEKVHDLRYGENPHQRGGLYREAGGAGPLGGAEVLQGKEMSYNNWLDAWAAYELVSSMPAGSCVIVKHNNPCGAAARRTPADSYRAALASDEVSAFGSVVAFNDEVDAETAEATAGVFTEVVVAPSFAVAARAAFARRPNVRLVTAPPIGGDVLDVRSVPGGALVQDRDVVRETRAEMKVVSSREPTQGEWDDLLLAWTIAWRVQSNAIVLVREGATVGIGAGQMSRVDSAWIAVRKAGKRAQRAVVASDAFFPFPDALDVAADAGCTAVIHPGGSRGDEAVLAAAESRGMAVVLTGIRHFRH